MPSTAEIKAQLKKAIKSTKKASDDAGKLRRIRDSGGSETLQTIGSVERPPANFATQVKG